MSFFSSLCCGLVSITRHTLALLLLTVPSSRVMRCAVMTADQLQHFSDLGASAAVVITFALGYLGGYLQ